jgi:hypothetical protein
VATRNFLKHTVSSSEPTGSSLGDEWYNPTTNKIFKRLVVNGTNVEFREIPAALTVQASGVTVAQGASIINFNGYTLTVDGTGAVNVAVPTAAAAGSTGQIQFNNVGSLGASSSLTWTAGSSTLSVTGFLTTFALSRSGNINAASWTTTSPMFNSSAAVLTDTTGAGTIAIRAGHSLLSPNFASSSAVTITDAANLYVNGNVAGTNTSITNNWSIYNAGNMRVTGTLFTDVNIAIGASSGSIPLNVKSSGAITVGTLSTYAAAFGNAANGDFAIGSDATITYLQTFNSKTLQINNQGNNVVITPVNGNVGIGTGSTTPGYRAHIMSAQATPTTTFAARTWNQVPPNLYLQSSTSAIGAGGSIGFGARDSAATDYANWRIRSVFSAEGGGFGANLGLLFDAAPDNSGTTNLTNVLMLRGNGHVGIGGIPTARLHIQGSAVNDTVLDVDHSNFGGRNVRFPGRVVIGPHGGNYPGIYYNATPTNAGGWNYVASDTAYRLDLGNNSRMGFHYAASGTAGNAITWTEGFFLNNSGLVGIGNSDGTSTLTVRTASTLGGTTGNNVRISTTQAVGGSGGNNVYRSEWRRRRATGTDWVTHNVHDGIWVDGTFTTPGTDTRAWWDRDPNTASQAWGDQATTWMFANSVGLGIGTTNPSGRLHLFQSSGGSNTLTLDTNFASGNAYAINPFISGVSNGGFSIRDVTNAVERIVISATAGNIGMGMTTPQYRLDVNNGVTGSNSFQASFGSTISAGLWSGIHFGYSEAANTSYRKSALVFERQDGAARGKIHILNNGTNGAASATLADARITIGFDGNVGVGQTNPVAKFEVSGTAGQLLAVTDSMTGTIFAANDASGIPSIEVIDTGLVKLAEYGGFVAYGVSNAVSAAGTTQATATLLTRPINNVTTVAANSGVLLPSAYPGMRVLVRNATVTTLRVYPGTGAQINTLGTNTQLNLETLANIEFVAFTTTQWYTVNATFA